MEIPSSQGGICRPTARLLRHSSNSALLARIATELVVGDETPAVNGKGKRSAYSNEAHSSSATSQRKSPRTVSCKDVGDSKQCSSEISRQTNSNSVEQSRGKGDTNEGHTSVQVLSSHVPASQSCYSDGTECSGTSELSDTAGTSINMLISCRVACQSWSGRMHGVKKPNQDAYCLKRAADKRSYLFGVFDGHGDYGQQVSGFVKDKLPLHLINDPRLMTDIRKAYMQAFLAIDKSVGEHVECSLSGTTAVVGHLFDTTLTIAWTGDSRGVLGRKEENGDWEALPLTVDHKPDHMEEKLRIIESNGRVDRSADKFGDQRGPYRVWHKYAPIMGLAMSRSLGDTLAHSVGVSAEPEVVVHNMRETDKFLILASDGVWEVIESEEAVQIVGSCATPESGCKRLMMTARSRWQSLGHGLYVDDITAMIVSFIHRTNFSS